jgi:hypothetical protein
VSADVLSVRNTWSPSSGRTEMDEMTFGDKVLAVLTIGIVVMVFAMELK